MVEADKCEFGQFSACAVKHIAIRLAEIISAAAGAGFEKSSGGACAGAGLFTGNRTPVVWVRCKQARAALNTFVSFGEFFHGRGTLADNDVTGMNGIVRDLALMKGGKNPAFAENKYRARRIGFTEKLGRV